MIELKNEQLAIQVAEMGAELQSVKDCKGREYDVVLDRNSRKYSLKVVSLR